MKILSFVLILFLFSSCISEHIESPYKGDGTQIEIYLIKDELIEDFDPFKEINENDLESDPWLRYDDIEFYDWSSHSFYLKNVKPPDSGRGRHFVLTADKNPLFVGFFYSMFMSSIPPFPAILNDFSFYPDDIICLNTFGYQRSDSLLSKSSEYRFEMENSGLLREGIDVELKELRRVNSSTLEYSFSVTNRDVENIYVLDPQKMGTSYFHYFTNGVSLRTDNHSYYANDFESTRSDEMKFEWYTKLSPGESIVRSVNLNGFNELPKGNVKASFHFPGAHYLQKGEWKKPDGRIWLGNFRTEKELNLQ